MRDYVITPNERSLLLWLGEEEFSQYGECYGAALDILVARGLAIIHHDGSNQNGFIAKGSSLMFCAVSLTDEGKKLLAQIKESEKADAIIREIKERGDA
jgi:hypothetical protein